MKPRLARVDILPTSSDEKNAVYNSNTRRTMSTQNQRGKTSWTKERGWFQLITWFAISCSAKVTCVGNTL